jgi:endonuclease III
MGNSVVPQVVELLGRAILKREEMKIAADPLFQESMRGDAFAMLLGCILVNRTRWAQAATVHRELISRYPSAGALGAAVPSDLHGILRPLGFVHQRSSKLVAFAAAWALLSPRSRSDVVALPGCGKYAADTWSIFVEGDMSIKTAVTDARLRSYLVRIGELPTNVQDGASE